MSEATDRAESSEDRAASNMQKIVDSGMFSFEEVPKVRCMTRPAPIPDGKIAVVLKSFYGGYFLVDKDPECKVCGGDGIDKSDDASSRLTEVAHCPACIMPEITNFGRVWEQKLLEREQEEEAERVDGKLKMRVDEARARVEELMKGKADALGQNVLDVQSTKEQIEARKADADRLNGMYDEYSRRLKEATKEFDTRVRRAQEEFDNKVKALREALTETQMSIKRERDQYVNEHGRAIDTLDREVQINKRELAKAEEDLKRYEAGPAKIAKRWDEKIAPAKKTLERLERQWKS